MNFGADVRLMGLDEFERRLDKAGDIIKAAAFEVEAEAKTAIQTGAKSGRLYKRGKRTHRASAEGEAPASDTGALVNSIRAHRVRRLLWEVRVGQLYGALLELKLNRPFLLPALEKVRERFVRAMQRLFESR